jgi:geranylgeranyl pyrophosphate synthase
MMLGAPIAEATEAATSLVDEFGRDLGIALQMFDDLGNVLGIREPAKKYEDLVLYRPSWAWGCRRKNEFATELRAVCRRGGQVAGRPRTGELD